MDTMLRSANDDEVLQNLDPACPPFAPDPRLDEWRTKRDACTVPTVDLHRADGRREGRGKLHNHDGDTIRSVGQRLG